jgi:hypothetical protein
MWYMILAGLLTRAALEGYLTASWRGSEGVECLLGLGMGLGGRYAYAANATPELGNMYPSGPRNRNGVSNGSESGAYAHAHGNGNGNGNRRDENPGHHHHHHHEEDQHDDEEHDEDEDEEDDFEEFDPDELPTLLESAKILFPSLRGTEPVDLFARRGRAEDEYGVEMEERLRRVGIFL